MVRTKYRIMTVADLFTAFATSLTASASTLTIEARFFFAILPSLIYLYRQYGC